MQGRTASTASSVPRQWLDGCIAAQRRIEAIVESLPDATARQATALEGWTVGHILTHVARNADAHAGIVEAAQRGEMVPMYPGGRAQRDGAIEAGAGRPAAGRVARGPAAHPRRGR